jgi:hypothetical protein
MHSEPGLIKARFAKTNKEIGFGSDPDSSDGPLDVAELLKNLN